MDRDTAVELAQQGIRANNRRLVEALLARHTARELAAGARETGAAGNRANLPLIAVTCATGWECYAIVEELVLTRRFRVRALYRTPGTQAAARLEALFSRTESEAPGLLALQSGVDMNSAEALTRGFDGCAGVVLYNTANTSRAGRVTNHGNDPVGGRAVVMRQVMAALAALRANPSVRQVVCGIGGPDRYYTLNFLWWLRELIDWLFGGPGFTRGRRDPAQLRLGDTIDYWTVIGLNAPQRLTLHFGMKCPGSGVLEYEIETLAPGRSQLTVTAYWHPRGVWGLLYWYALVPAHLFLFKRFTRVMARRAEQLDAAALT